MAGKAKSETVHENNRISEALAQAPGGMRLEVVTFKIIGISPLLQNNPEMFIGTSAADDGLAAKKVYSDTEEADKRCYRRDGHFAHPAVAFLKAAGRAVVGRKFGKVSAPAAIRGSVFLAEPYCVLQGSDGKPLEEYAIDRQSVVVNKKSRVLRCRPLWFPWQTQLALEIDAALIKRAAVLEALSLAGRTIGVGDYRPEKGGGNGRFRCE